MRWFQIAVWAILLTAPANAQNWPQWGRNPQHTGMVSVSGQWPDRLISDIVYDPVIQDAKPDFHNEVLAHYQAPLVDGDDVFMMFKRGNWVSCQTNPDPCGTDAWSAITWSVKRLHWEDGILVEKWSFDSDWLPPPGAVARTAPITVSSRYKRKSPA